MTNNLKRAFDAASRLPHGEQDALAAAILEEVHSEPRWTASFAAHADALAGLAGEALAEHHAGRSQPLLPDNL